MVSKALIPARKDQGLGPHHVDAYSFTQPCWYDGCAASLTFHQTAYNYLVTHVRWEPDFDGGYSGQLLTITHGDEAKTFTWRERCRGDVYRWLDALHREESP